MEPAAYREMAAIEQEHWWFAARRAILDDTIRRLALPTDASLLEVGAGTGGNVDLLRRHGQLSAIEPDAYAREHLGRATGLEARDGALPHALPAFPQPFDLVCLFDVLEHIEHDLESLRTLRTHLAPGGRFLITVPAYPWMWSGHDVELHHFRRYTKQGLTRVLRDAGLTVDRLTSFNTLLFPAAVAARLAARVTGATRPPGSGMQTGPMNAVLRWIFANERHLLRRFNLPFGLSLMAIASH